MSTIIPLDGPTSSGKTSVGFLFSKKIGYTFIDSGAIYRAGAILVLDQGVSQDNEDQIAVAFHEMKLEFSELDGRQHTILNGNDISDHLHDPEVTTVVPIIGAFQKVRDEATIIQRELCLKQDTVLAGRDIGTAIFPDSKLKFYLTADIQVRANRRLSQLRLKIPGITFEQVLEDMIERDKKDMIRKVSPLRIPENAVIIDTTNHTTEESVERMMTEYRKAYEQ